MSYVYGNLTGTASSKFRTDIEYSITDKGSYKQIAYRYLIEVTSGDFYGTSFSTSWGGNVSVGGYGEHGYSGWYYKNVSYGSSVTITGSSSYYGSSGNYYSSSATLNYTAPRPTYTVSYNANGGTGAPGSQTKTYGINLTLSKTVPTRTGYVFKGWATSSTSSVVSYSAGGIYRNNASITLYAVWQLIVYSVTYDAETNGGTVNGAGTYTVTKSYGSVLGELPIPVRTNYKFIGWNTQVDGKGLMVARDTFVYGDSYLYAIFELQANCYIKDIDYKAGMMYIKKEGTYKTGAVYVRKDGVYKQTNM